jgi:hypothetical protein
MPLSSSMTTMRNGGVCLRFIHSAYQPLLVVTGPDGFLFVLTFKGYDGLSYSRLDGLNRLGRFNGSGRTVRLSGSRRGQNCGFQLAVAFDLSNTSFMILPVW